VKPWFDGKIDFAPIVKDLSAQGYPLIGGRLDYIHKRTVAALVYQRRKHYINLFIWPAAASDRPEERLSDQGYNVISWTSNQANYWAVSDLNNEELLAFAQLIRE
jgi:anti-sigma factor RsiW